MKQFFVASKATLSQAYSETLKYMKQQEHKQARADPLTGPPAHVPVISH